MKQPLALLRSLLSRSAALIVGGVAAITLIALLAFSALSVLMIAAVIGLTGLLLARLHGPLGLQPQPARQQPVVLDARMTGRGHWEADRGAR
ncbi:MAG: hypothetical protein MUF14_05055 [Hyphomonadaceae bacterium]|jgi:hypothetical protein|nr:hypothetical protein [Hyphomonadaceae bacterium]